jgi:hypothetical protein
MISLRAAAMFGPAVLALALAGCGEGEQPPPPIAARLPAKVCDKAKEALDKLSGTGSFEYSADGQATIDEAMWLPMAGGQRDAIAQGLAFHTACAAKEPPREVTVTIRNEGGRTLTQRVVETSVDIGRALEQ